MSVLAIVATQEGRGAQLWDTADRSIGAPTGARCTAAIQHPPHGVGQLFWIGQDCPAGWVDVALRLFQQYRAGQPITGTHTISWAFSTPTFTLLDPPASADPVVIEEPLDLGDWEANA